jgi:NTP pyrophosphatase (non-canonical NTP hydrolase)
MSFQGISDVAAALRAFAEARDWDQFHTPRNLAAAMSVEASEVLEHFQWLTDEQSASLSAEKKEEVAMELADVFLYLVRLSDRLGSTFCIPPSGRWRSTRRTIRRSSQEGRSGSGRRVKIGDRLQNQEEAKIGARPHGSHG